MSESSEEHSEVYNYYLELSKPTEEDLKRVFSKEELTELCLKTKCKVDIWRWNVVNDYRILFTQSGRYQRWSEKTRLGTLAKAVNKMKPSVLYNEEEIKKQREEEWKFQLKDNILSLDFWKRKKHTEVQTVLTQSDGIDPELQLQFEVNTESAEPLGVSTSSQRQEFEDVVDADKPDKDLHSETEKEGTQAENVETIAPSTREKLSLAIDGDIDDDDLSDMFSEDSLETVMLPDHQKPHEILNSEEVAPVIANMYCINTLSMTMDSETSQRMTQELAAPQSQEVIPDNYDHFKDIIPLTSTQSQSQGTKEFVV